VHLNSKELVFMYRLKLIFTLALFLLFISAPPALSVTLSPSSDTTWQDEDQVVTASYLWVNRNRHERFSHGWRGILREANDLARDNSAFIAGLSTTSSSFSWGGSGQMWLVVRSHGGSTARPTFLSDRMGGSYRVDDLDPGVDGVNFSNGGSAAQSGTFTSGSSGWVTDESTPFGTPYMVFIDRAFTSGTDGRWRFRVSVTDGAGNTESRDWFFNVGDTPRTANVPGAHVTDTGGSGVARVVVSWSLVSGGGGGGGGGDDEDEDEDEEEEEDELPPIVLPPYTRRLRLIE
jgi:hypothetical protein